MYFLQALSLRISASDTFVYPLTVPVNFPPQQGIDVASAVFQYSVRNKSEYLNRRKNVGVTTDKQLSCAI